jgi:hypothetical protein
VAANRRTSNGSGLRRGRGQSRKKNDAFLIVRGLTNRYRPPGLTNNMIDPIIIKHPLEECVSFGNISDLDLRGRNSLDLIMTMIGDLRFRNDRIEGTCARYFLLVDLSVIQHLCVSAHINSDKLRDYARRCDSLEGREPTNLSDGRRTDISSLAKERRGTRSQDSQFEARLPFESYLEQTELPGTNGAKAREATKLPHELPARHSSPGHVRPHPSTAHMMADRRTNGRNGREVKRA